MRRFFSRKRMYPMLLTMSVLSFINVSLLKVRLSLDTDTEKIALNTRKTEEARWETAQSRGETTMTRVKTVKTRGKTVLTSEETVLIKEKTVQNKGKTELIIVENAQTRRKTSQTRGKIAQTSRRNEEGNLCNRTIEYTASHTTRIHDVFLLPDKVDGKRKGGESIEEVKGQKEQNEYFRFRYGLLTVSCNGSLTAKTDYEKAMKRIKLKPDSYINNMLSAIHVSNLQHKLVARQKVFGVTVAVCRKDYANLYWTVLELYSAYFTARTSGSPIQESTLLLLDAHPAGKLDEMWQILFKKTLRLGLLNETVHFTELTFRPYIKLMPIVRKKPPIPYFNDFRHDMTERAGASPTRSIDCRVLTITFVVRKNYVAHPRNLKGEISRKLQNSEEVLHALNSSFPQDKVRGVSFEDLSVREQVKLSSETDILLGVHGAGLAHTVFQVPGTGLIELFPKEYRPKKKRNPHFQQLAEWSGKLYTSWFSNLTANHLSFPPSVVTSLVQDMRTMVCAGRHNYSSVSIERTVDERVHAYRN